MYEMMFNFEKKKSTIVSTEHQVELISNMQILSTDYGIRKLNHNYLPSATSLCTMCAIVAHSSCPVSVKLYLPTSIFKSVIFQSQGTYTKNFHILEKKIMFMISFQLLLRWIWWTTRIISHTTKSGRGKL